MKKRALFSIICVALCAGLMATGTNALALEAEAGPPEFSSEVAEPLAQTDVSYLDENGELATLTEPYTIVTDTTTAVTWTDGWYVADGTVAITNTITVNGDVKLILCDGAQLTTKNICVNEGNTFSIYCQSDGTGSLSATSSSNVSPGIGAGRYKSGGNINIYGGIITAQGGKEGAGIGGSASCGHGGIVRIYGGKVTAVGGYEHGAGIGGGGWDQSTSTHGGNGANAYIYGGTVTAKGGGSAPSIGAGGSSSNNGSFSTGENGMAVIYADSIRDQSKKSQWSGIIFQGTSGTVYKDQALKTDLTVGSGTTLTIPENARLTVPAGVTLTNNGTINDNGVVANNGTIVNNGTIRCRVTKKLTNLTSAGGSNSVTKGTAYATTLTAAEDYVLPRSVTVKVGDTILKAGEGYSYDSATGALAIDGAAITSAVTITAAAATVLDEVNITIPLPKGEQPLSSDATCETEGIESVSLYWTDTENNPVSGDARYFPWCYKAHMIVSPKEGHILTDATTVQVNGESPEEKVLNADGTLSVASPYYSNQVKLLAVTQPEDIGGVAHGTAKTATALGLPSTVAIATETPSIHSAEVTWDLNDLAEGSYHPMSAAEQTFRVKGIVSLPEEVATPDNISLEVTVGVTVLGAVPGAHLHDWKVFYEWGADGKSCTATRTCSTDASHTETARGTVSGKETKAATCTDAGETTYTATFAESWAATQTKAMADIPPTGHKLAKTAAKAASCTDAGNAEYWTCETCGKLFSDEKGAKEISPGSAAIQAIGHHYVDGKCADCGAVPSATDDKATSNDKTALAQTSDNGNLHLLIPLLLASAAAVIALVQAIERRCYEK